MEAYRILKETAAEESEPTGASVVWSFAIIVLGAIGTIIVYGLVFIVLRKRDPRYFAPYQPNGKCAKAETFWILMKRIYAFNNDEIVDAGGVEGLLFILRGRMNFAIGLRCCVVAILATGIYASTPIDASCVKTLTKLGCRRPGFERLSLTNVPDRNWRLWIVPLAAFYLAYSCLHLIQKFDKLAASIAFQAVLNDAPDHLRAVILTDLPPSLQNSEQSIRTFFKKMGLRGVTFVTMLRDLDHPEFSQDTKQEEHEEKTTEIIDQPKKLAKKMQKESQKALKKGLTSVAKATEHIGQDFVGTNVLALGEPGPRRLLSEYETALAALARAETLYATKCSKKDSIVTMRMSNMVKGVTGIVGVELDEKASLIKARKYAEEKRTAILKYILKRQENKIMEPSRAALVVFSRVSEAILAAAAPLIVSEQQFGGGSIERTSATSRPSDLDTPPSMLKRRYFVSKSSSGASTSEKEETNQEDMHLQIVAAPELRDIEFQVLESMESADQRHRSHDQGQTAKIMLNVYFMTVLTITQAAAGRFVQNFADDSPKIYGDADLVGIVGNALPAIIQIYFLDIAVAFFKRIALRFDAHWSKSSVELRLYHDFAPFLILNFFVSNLVGGSLINSLFVISKNPSLFLKQLGIGVIDQAPYFGQVAFLRLVQLLTKSSSGARVYDFFTDKLLMQRCVTKFDLEAIYAPGPIGLAVPASWADLFVLLSIIFAPFGACPTSICCLIFIVSDLFFAKYKICAVYKPTFNNYGAKLWPVYVDHNLRALRLALFLALLIMILICDKNPKQHTFYVALALIFINFYARDKCIAINRARQKSFFALLHSSRCALPLLAASKIDSKNSIAQHEDPSLWSAPHALLDSFVSTTLEQTIPSPDQILSADQTDEEASCSINNNDQETELALDLQAQVNEWVHRHTKQSSSFTNETVSSTHPNSPKTDDDDVFYDAEEGNFSPVQQEEEGAFAEKDDDDPGDDPDTINISST